MKNNYHELILAAVYCYFWTFLLLWPGTASGGEGGWQGLVDRAAALETRVYDFGDPGGGNENYYDGDFADFDGDGHMDRALISRYGLLWNSGGGVLLPVSTQELGRPPNTSPSLSGYLFGDEVQIGNDAVQWADIDGDGDLDNVQGGNGEPFTIQTNRRGRFAVKKKYTGSALNIVSIDIERDGDVDLAVAHSFCSDARCGHGCPEQNCSGGSWPKEFHLWVNNGGGNFTDQAAQRGFNNIGRDLIVGLVAGDVDADRDFDLLLLSGCSDGTVAGCSTAGMVRGVALARNDGSGSFSLEAVPFAVAVRPIGPITSGFNQGMNLGDIDDDGDLDLVCALERDLAPHPKVGHAVFINGGAGDFVEESATRFIVPPSAGFLGGGNGKLADLDHDGDLDFLAFQRDSNRLQVFLNDGGGILTYDPGRSLVLPGEPTALGNDTDVSDIDGDGTYDVWLGSAGTIVRPLINTHRDPSGLPADMPRDLTASAAGSAIAIRFRAPPFAANVRHYRVYRSLAPGIAARDRLLRKTVANSRHEDEGFAAPITRHTTTGYLGDPDVEIEGEEIVFTDREVTPGVGYHYSVSHVGTENNAGRPTAEAQAGVPGPGGPDMTAPALDILSPDAEWWSPNPRIVIQFADGGSGVDPESLRVSFDVALGSGDPLTGGRPAGADLSDLYFRKDGNAYVYSLGEDQGLPVGLVMLTVRVADRSGNETTRKVTFNVSVSSPQPPVARLTAEPLAGEAPLDVSFSGAESSDSDGVLLRWEWYFGDGGEAFGQAVARRFEVEGAYDVTLLVRDNEGGVSAAMVRIVVSGPEDVPYRRADSNCDGGVDVSDAIFTLRWMFSGAAGPCCMDAADANGSSDVDISDAVFTVLWLFRGGESPPAPGPVECGPGGSLGCEAYPGGEC